MNKRIKDYSKLSSLHGTNVVKLFYTRVLIEKYFKLLSIKIGRMTAKYAAQSMDKET